MIDDRQTTVGPSGTVIEPLRALNAQARAYRAGERGLMFVDRDASDPDLVQWARGEGLHITEAVGGAYLTLGDDDRRVAEDAAARERRASREDRERIRAQVLGYTNAKPDLDGASSRVRETLDSRGRVVAQEVVDKHSPPPAPGQRDVSVQQVLAERAAARNGAARDVTGFPTIRLLRNEDDVARLHAAASEDDHVCIGPTHVFGHGGEIQGYFGMGRVPTITFWADSRSVKPRESLHVIRCLETLAASAGHDQIMTMCARSSPFHAHMERLGYQRVETDIFIKNLES